MDFAYTQAEDTVGHSNLLEVPAPAVQCIAVHLSRQDKQALAATSAKVAAWLMHGCSRVSLNLTACVPHRRQLTVSWAAQHASRVHLQLGTMPGGQAGAGDTDALHMLQSALPAPGLTSAALTSMKLQDVMINTDLLLCLAHRCPQLTCLKLRHCQFQQLGSLQPHLIEAGGQLQQQQQQQRTLHSKAMREGTKDVPCNNQQAIVSDNQNSSATVDESVVCTDVSRACDSVSRTGQASSPVLFAKLHSLDIAYGSYSDSWRVLARHVTHLTLGPFTHPQRVPLQALEHMPPFVTHLTLTIGAFTNDQQALVTAFYEQLSRLVQLRNLELIYTGPLQDGLIPLPSLLLHLSLPPVEPKQLVALLQHPHLISLETGMPLLAGTALGEVLEDLPTTCVKQLKLTKGSMSLAALAALSSLQLQQPLMIQGEIVLQLLRSSEAAAQQLHTLLGVLQQNLPSSGGFCTVRDLHVYGRCGLPVDDSARQPLETPEYLHHVMRDHMTSQVPNNADASSDEDSEREPEGTQEGGRAGVQVLHTLLPYVRSIGGEKICLARMVVGQDVLQALTLLRHSFRAPSTHPHPHTLVFERCVLRSGFWQYLHQLFLGDPWVLPGPSCQPWHVEIHAPLNVDAAFTVSKIVSFCRAWQHVATNPHARKLRLTCLLHGCLAYASAQGFLAQLSISLREEVGLQAHQVQITTKPFDCISINLGPVSNE